MSEDKKPLLTYLEVIVKLVYREGQYTENDYIRIQMLNDEILDARNNDLLDSYQYSGLHFLVQWLKETCRKELREAGALK